MFAQIIRMLRRKHEINPYSCLITISKNKTCLITIYLKYFLLKLHTLQGHFTRRTTLQRSNHQNCNFGKVSVPNSSTTHRIHCNYSLQQEQQLDKDETPLTFLQFKTPARQPKKACRNPNPNRDEEAPPPPHRLRSQNPIPPLPLAHSPPNPSPNSDPNPQVLAILVQIESQAPRASSIRLPDHRIERRRRADQEASPGGVPPAEFISRSLGSRERIRGEVGS